MFWLDEFLKQLSDAQHAVGGQRHADDDDRRDVAGYHLVSVQLRLSPAAAAAAATTQP